MKKEINQIDVEVSNHGSVFLFQPFTLAAQEWIEENVSNESQWFGSALAVEHRFAFDLAQGMLDDGLIVE